MVVHGLPLLCLGSPSAQLQLQPSATPRTMAPSRRQTRRPLSLGEDRRLDHRFGKSLGFAEHLHPGDRLLFGPLHWRDRLRLAPRRTSIHIRAGAGRCIHHEEGPELGVFLVINHSDILRHCSWMRERANRPKAMEHSLAY